jgi:hypothetical protein
VTYRLSMHLGIDAVIVVTPKKSLWASDESWRLPVAPVSFRIWIVVVALGAAPAGSPVSGLRQK